jgi:hypothetical protein
MRTPSSVVYIEAIYYIIWNLEDYKPLNISLSDALGMALGEKLFEESGEITGLKITRVHPIEGVTTEVSFTSEIRGEGRFPSGQSLGSGIMTKYPHGIIDGTWHGSLMTADDGDQFMWWSHEKSKVVEGGNIKGLNIMTGFTNSQKLSWMNNIILALEISGSVFSQKFKATGYEWK